MTHSSIYLNDAPDRRSHVLLLTVLAAIAIFIGWAYFAVLDEVAVGNGKVIPSSKEQVIQSLEGGILSEMFVREGDIVGQGQELAVLDQSVVKSTVEEVASKISVLQARAARLRAEMEDKDDVRFPADTELEQTIKDRELELFHANRDAFHENRASLQQQFDLTNKELTIVKPLLKRGAANEIEVLKLQQRVAELQAKLQSLESEYYVQLKKDYSETMGELEPLLKVREGRADQLRRTVITSPTRGIVKEVAVSTIGGVVGPGGVIMQIIPLDDQLLIEAQLSPRDIAFIHPDQKAIIKITAYDYAIYGTLQGRVERISPDTIEDKVERNKVYYRVYVVTDHSYLETKDGKRHPIIPGMVATAEIQTGSKTVLDYLIKPLDRAAEALRER
jgi:membrane fusion protein, adhesin transport system